NFFRHDRIHRRPFDPHRRADNGYHIEIRPIRIEQFDRFSQKNRNSSSFAASSNSSKSLAEIRNRIEAKDEAIGPGINERINPYKRIGRHEMDFERKPSVRPKRFYQIGEEEH